MIGARGGGLGLGKGPDSLILLLHPFRCSLDMPPALLKTARIQERLAKREQLGRSAGVAVSQAGQTRVYVASPGCGGVAMGGPQSETPISMSFLARCLRLSWPSTQQHPSFE